MNYTLNIIDTPGFGDTRGIQRDQEIIDQIRQLFSSRGDKGVLYIDAVCFIVKAPDARLTITQKYIFTSIMSLFGKDIEENICTLITFTDGAEPPVLASLREAKIPFGTAFQFNNSALFADNKSSASLAPMFWEIGCSSFKNFFDKLSHFNTKSLVQTSDVLKEREQLKTVISGILPQINNGLVMLETLRSEAQLFKDHEAEIKRNEKFEYEVEVPESYIENIPVGVYVTNCLICNRTCHETCIYPDDDDKKYCGAMSSDGNCRVCPNKCVWSSHRNAQFRYKFRLKKVKKTYEDLKEQYQKAVGETMTVQNVINALLADVDKYSDNVNAMLEEIVRCKNRLKEIALRPDPLTMVENIELMIAAEESEKHPGFDKRIKMLHHFKSLACYEQKVSDFKQDFEKTKRVISSTVAKKIESIKPISEGEKAGFLQRSIERLKNFFTQN